MTTRPAPQGAALRNRWKGVAAIFSAPVAALGATRYPGNGAGRGNVIQAYEKLGAEGWLRRLYGGPMIVQPVRRDARQPAGEPAAMAQAGDRLELGDAR